MSAQRGGGIGPNECAETYGIPKATLERHLDNSKKYGNKQETRKTSSSLQHHTLHQMTTQSSDVFGEVRLLLLIQLYIWTETVVPNPVIMLQKTSHAGSLRNRMIDFCLKKFEILSEYMKNDVLNADIPAHIRYSFFFDHVSAMINPNCMVGELEINYTAQMLKKNIIRLL